MFAIGIDLGTTNSAVAILKGRPVIVEDFTGNRTLPSAVGWDSELSELIVGIDAKNNADVYKTVLSVKRDMGTEKRFQVGPHSWLPEEVSAEILKVLKRQVEEKTGEPVTEAIITVPAYFQMAQMAATKRAGELAGLKVQQLLAEPSAAVMAYGPRDDEKILVYDLGGGTFDVAIIDYFAGVLTTKAVFGNNYLGGDDFDKRIMNHLVKLIEQEHRVTIDLENDIEARCILMRNAEMAKIEMSRKQGARITIPKVTEIDGRPIGIAALIKTAEFNTMIHDLVESTLSEIQKALEHAELSKSDIDTVLLVGGSTYVPYVQQMVRDFFGKEPNKTINPDLAVAQGAAASLLLDKEQEGGRHVVSVGFVPEMTPEEELEIEGRTTGSSQLQISGGLETVNTQANDEGYYDATVKLTKGSNTLAITATAPDGRKATIEPEPVIFNPDAEEVEEPPSQVAPRLPRGLCVSCNLPLGPQRDIAGYASVILQPQTELPCSFSAKDFATQVDSQTQIMCEIVEGTLPLAALNTNLSRITLQLPPNVPRGEQVVIHFSVDESFILTAELEVPSINRRSKVTVSLNSQAEQVHIIQQVEDLLTRAGDRIRPEEKAAIMQSRLATEDICTEFRRSIDAGNDLDGLWGTYQRLQTAVQQLRTKLDSLKTQYA